MSTGFADLVQVLVSGLGQGSVYALVALGLTLIYRSTTTLNFAHGALFMLAPFIALALYVRGTPLLFSIVVALLAVAILGWVVDKMAFEPLLEKDHITQVFATVAIGFIITGAVRYVTVDQHAMPPFLGNDAYVDVLGAKVSTQYFVMIAALVLTSLALAYFFLRTQLGLIIRACTGNLRGASLVGINVRRVFGLMWALGALLAGLAGVLAAPTLLVGADIGNRPLIIGLAAMALGGFGSIPGAVLGGLLMGLLEVFGAFYISTQLGDVTGLLVILLLLLVRPTGILGSSETRLRVTA